MKHVTTYLVAIALVLAMSIPIYAIEGRSLTQVADVTVTGTATLIKAQREIRTALNCTNTHATVHVRWGDSAVTAVSGQQLRAGMAIEIENRAAVYMISEGVDVTVSCTEETR